MFEPEEFSPPHPIIGGVFDRLPHNSCTSKKIVCAAPASREGKLDDRRANDIIVSGVL